MRICIAPWDSVNKGTQNNMAERPVDAAGRLQERCTAAPRIPLVEQDEIIDVDAFDFDDSDAWLYVPSHCSTEPKVHDLYTWLRSEPDLPDSEPSPRRSIDTRTFTRPKKRTSRTSFESIFEAMTPTSPNVWKTQNSSLINAMGDASRNTSSSASNKEETVPAMLKTAPSLAANFIYEGSAASSGQESMEAFLNMSQSKEYDSFINLTEAAVTDPLMNVSLPSVLYSSIMSIARDDSVNSTDCEEDPEHLTQMINLEVSKLEALGLSNHVNETFSASNNSTIANRTYTGSPANRTFANTTTTLDKVDLNETYNAQGTPTVITLLPSSDKDKNSTVILSSTSPSPKRTKAPITLDATYLSGETKKNDFCSLDATYSTLQDETKDLVHETRSNKLGPSEIHISNPPRNLIETSTPIANLPSFRDIALDSTFKLPVVPGNQSTPKTPEALNSTYKTIAKHAGFKVPFSLRRELLAEIQRSAERRLDSTYDQANDQLSEKNRKESDVAHDQSTRNNTHVENKYNTYKKDTDRPKHQDSVQSEAGANLQDRRFYTFTRKTGLHGARMHAESSESLENLDVTCTKATKLQKKTHVPRMLSKLPHFLQKSNPNLVSNSLKTVNMGCGSAASLGYMKGSQPNIGRESEKTMANKLYSLGQIKSGSEQRLLELNTAALEFQLTGAGGSTESIESTQSTHSAPDLNDRLSTCSDCSHNSYTTQTMNIEQLHQIVRMQEESLKQESTPKLNRRVLENTWIDGKKDLMSPTLSNETESAERDTSSPLNIDATMQIRSPQFSPIESSESLNSDGQPTDILKQQNDVTVVKKVEQMIAKPTARFENKTRLRQPTNWSGGIRPSNIGSGIPRPPSRIPGPRFSRPLSKPMQGDVKRGYQ